MAAPHFDLSGKVALITGAGRGIGRGIGEALASAGCSVAIQDIDEAVAADAAEHINRAGGRAIALGGDITDLSLPQKLVESTRQQLGGIHVLVNNASIQARLHWTKVDRGDFDRTFHANLFSAVLLCQQVEPAFRQQRWGRIVNVGSIQQRRGNEHMLTYAMTKAALENMTYALARDFAKDGVTVNLIAPGYFRTLRNPQLDTPEGLEHGNRIVRMGRVGEPEDAAGLALLLCSDAGGYITGQSIYVDGGMGL